jgi:hypothetical protein
MSEAPIDPAGILQYPYDRAQIRGLMPLHATHHISTNHLIEIDGYTARSNSYMQAMHVVKPADQTKQWLVGGWYDNEYRRTADGWKITRAVVTSVWEAGPARGPEP